MLPQDDDEEGNAGDLLDMLSGEVDDYAGKGLGIEEPENPAQKLLTLEISIVPGGAAAQVTPDRQPGDETGNGATPEDSDPVAHELGLCGGGCAYCRGGEVE
jgi:hypothetical protein